jgi:hypothetical protein
LRADGHNTPEAEQLLERFMNYQDEFEEHYRTLLVRSRETLRVSGYKDPLAGWSKDERALRRGFSGSRRLVEFKDLRLKHMQLALRHIYNARTMILKQYDLIETLHIRGADTEEAEVVLARLKDTQRDFVNEYIRLVTGAQQPGLTK